MYVTDDNDKKEKKRSSGFYKFMILLQTTASFVSKSQQSSHVAEGGEERSGLSAWDSWGPWGYFWLYIKTLSFCKRWRAKIGMCFKVGVANK